MILCHHDYPYTCCCSIQIIILLFNSQSCMAVLIDIFQLCHCHIMNFIVRAYKMPEWWIKLVSQGTHQVRVVTSTGDSIAFQQLATLPTLAVFLTDQCSLCILSCVCLGRGSNAVTADITSSPVLKDDQKFQCTLWPLAGASYSGNLINTVQGQRFGSAGRPSAPSASNAIECWSKHQSSGCIFTTLSFCSLPNE